MHAVQTALRHPRASFEWRWGHTAATRTCLAHPKSQAMALWLACVGRAVSHTQKLHHRYVEPACGVAWSRNTPWPTQETVGSAGSHGNEVALWWRTGMHTCVALPVSCQWNIRPGATDHQGVAAAAG